MNFSALDEPKKVFKFCWDTKNNEAFPLDLACPKRLNVRSLAVLIKVVIIQKNDLPKFGYKRTRYESREKTKSSYIFNYMWEFVINI